MIEFLNVLFALVAGLIAGAAIHSAYLHSKIRGELDFIRPEGENGNEEGGD